MFTLDAYLIDNFIPTIAFEGRLDGTVLFVFIPRDTPIATSWDSLIAACISGEGCLSWDSPDAEFNISVSGKIVTFHANGIGPGATFRVHLPVKVCLCAFQTAREIALEIFAD